MPCRSDHMAPSDKEQQLQRVARLLVYVYDQTGVDASPQLRRTAEDAYARVDYTPELCAAVRALSPEQRDRIVFDGRSRTARDLADWWEDHQEADRVRAVEEALERMREVVRDRAMEKLTPEECEALGLKRRR